MNKRLLKLLLIYMVFATLRLYAQNTNDTYYYYKGKKIFLEIDYNRISISLRGKNAVKKIKSIFNKNTRSFSKSTLTEITQDYAKTSVIEIDTSTFNKNKSRRKKSVKNQGVSKRFYTEASFSKTYSDKEYKNLLESYNNITNIQAAPAFLTKEGKKMGLSNKFYVKLKKQEDLNDLLEKAKELKVEILGRDKFMPLWFTLVVTKGSNKNALELANLFHETGIFEASEPAFVYHDLLNISDPNISDPDNTIKDPNDPLFKDQWALENTGQNYGTRGVDIKAKEAWQITTGFNTKVAVIDGGIQKDHPDLESNLEPGYDAQTNSYPARLYIDRETFSSHGTSCAGIIGSIKDNNKGIAGIAPSSRLIPVSIDFDNSTADKFADAINWAWKNGADVISNSWGGGSPSEIETDAINNALTYGRKGKGTVVVFASGNENEKEIPFPSNSDPRILCVGAIDRYGKRSLWNYVRKNGHWYREGSNYGPKLDVVAGGTDIVTTNWKSSYDSLFGGTSAAAPFVAGVAALVISVNPDLTVTEVTDIIEKTAQKVGYYTYENDYENDRSNGTRNDRLGYGLVNAYEAVLLAQSPDYDIKIPPEGQAQCLEHDYLELAKLYKTTNGANWNNEWDLTKPISTWHGVTLTEDSCSVDTIDLSDLGIRGLIPNLDLSNLKYLDLSSNKLSEDIPKFDSLPSLQKLDLSHNELSGAIPNLQQLDTLDIRENNFTFKGIKQNLAIKNFRYSPQKPININTIYTSEEGGKLYVNVGGSVKNNTYTWYNKDGDKHQTIQGDSTLAITESGTYYCEVTNSEITNKESDYKNLVLQSDTIYINLCPLRRKHDSLELIKLYKATNGANWNNEWDLTKPISTWHGVTLTYYWNSTRLTRDNCSVKRINLGNSELIGSIPNLNLPKLERLMLFNNQLSGTIPNFDLPSLDYLSLFNNQLSGQIPNFNLPWLKNLYLSNNKLSGQIPNFDYLPSPNSVKLNASKNNFTFKDIPSSINVRYFEYSPQNNIPIYKKEGNKLYVEAGGGVENNTYSWYKGGDDSWWNRGDEYKTIEGDSILTVTESGRYYCKVTNSAVDKLTLQSDAIYVDICLSKLNGDSLELVKLYNATNGDQWENPWDLSQPVSTWHGVTLTDNGCSVKSIDLSDEGLSGQIPNLDLSNLESLNLSENQLSGSIPDFNNLNSLETLDISMNRFTFRGVPDSINVSTFEYFPQNNIPIYKKEGNKLYVEAGGGVENNTYSWYKGGDDSWWNRGDEYKTIEGDSILTVTESGRYYCKVTNSAVDKLTLQSDAIYVDICLSKLNGDSLELVKLYNATNGDQWENPWDLSQPVSTWHGVTLTDNGCSVKSIDLSDEGLSGQIPNLDLSNLESLNLSENQLSGSIPDFNNLNSLETLDISMNRFTFRGVPDSINVSTFEYFPQNNIPIYKKEGNKLYVEAGGGVENNTYSWYKGGDGSWWNRGDEYKTIEGDSILTVTESGRYYCKVTNSAVDKLTLQSDAIYVDICLSKLNGDSLELVKLYNATNGDQWENTWDLSQPVSTWHGITLTDNGCSVKSIDLSDEGLSGQIPNLDLSNLESLNLSENQLSGSIPDFNNLNSLETLDISMNRFTFRGVPDSINVSTFEYFPQNNIPIYKKEGNKLYVEAGGGVENNTYSWYKGGDDSWWNRGDEYKTIEGDSILTVTESGRYYCKVTNSAVDKLTLQSDAIYVDICLSKLNGDSLELVNLYNATNGDQWENPWDLSQPVSTWHGVTLTDNGCSVKSIDLSDEGLSGQIPNLDLSNLESLNLSKNQLSGSIPDFNNLNSLETLDISMNRFTFRGVPDSINVSTFEYFPQNVIGIYKSNIDKLYVNAGRGDTYTWYKDKVEYTTIQGDSTLTAKESGAYYCEVTKTVSLKGGNKKDIVLNSNILYMGAIQSQENQLTKRITREWDDDMLVFPNPAKERVYIYVPEVKGKQIDIQVFDQSGNLRMERSIKQFTDEKLTVDLSSLSHGYYYVQVQMEGKYMGVKTLIISH